MSSGRNQPKGAVRLASRFASSSPGSILLPGNGYRSILGDTLSLSRIKTGMPENRFEATLGGMGFRIYGTFAASDDDKLQIGRSIVTARGGSFTTVLVFIPKIQTIYTQGWLFGDTANQNVPTSHVVVLDEVSNAVTIGYDGANGYAHTGTFTPAVNPWGRINVAVVSTDKVAQKMSLAFNGERPTTFTNTPAAIGNGSNPGSGIVTLGSSRYPHAYNPEGHVLMWANLPGVFIDQELATEISRNPYSIFRPQQRMLFAVSEGAPILRRALISSNGQIREISDALVGTGLKPLVLNGGTIQERVTSEGLPLILINGNLQTLAATDTLKI